MTRHTEVRGGVHGVAAHDGGRTARVFVPIVPADGHNVATPLTLACMVAEPGSNDGASDVRLPDLEQLGAGLRPAGKIAQESVKALGLRRSRRWLPYGNDAAGPAPHLSTEGVEMGKFSPVSSANCHSADLGLALASLLSRLHRGGTVGTVIATGKLAALPKIIDGVMDVAVEPVGHLASKFDLILKQIVPAEKGAAGGGDADDHASKAVEPALRGPGHLIVPEFETIGGVGKRVSEAHADALKAIADHGFTIHHVASLRGAARAILGSDALKLPSLPWQRWADRAAAALLAVGIGLGGGYWYDRVLDLPLTPQPVDGTPTPVRAAWTDEGSPVPLPPCAAPADQRPALRVGEYLLVKAGAAGHRFDDLAYAVVWANADGSAKVFTSEMFETSPVTADGSLALPLTAVDAPGEAVVTVLARRLVAFDATTLRRRVETAMKAANGAASRLNAAAASLRMSAPGYLSIPIEVLPKGDPTCREG